MSHKKVNFKTFPTILIPADDLCKYDGPRSGPTKPWARFGPNMFDNLKIFLKKMTLKKKRRQPKGMPNYPIGVRSGSALFGFNPQKGYWAYFGYFVCLI